MKFYRSVFLTFLLFWFTLLQADLIKASNIESDIGVRLLSSDNTGIVLALTTPYYQLSDGLDAEGAACQRIEVDGYAHTVEAGAPLLPLAVTLLGVPPDSKITLTITSLENAQLPGPVRLCPVQQAVMQEEEGGLSRYVEQDASPDPDIYRQALFYPPTTARVHELGFLRSQRLVRVEIFPFQYSPMQGVVTYHRRLQVKVNFAQPTQTEQATVEVASAIVKVQQDFDSMTRDEAPAFEQALAANVLNYASAKAWHKDVSIQAAAATAWRPPASAYRILLRQSGMVALSYVALKAAGLPVDEIRPEQFAMFYNGEEIAIQVTGAADGLFQAEDRILFYARPYADRYSNTNVYWLFYDSPASDSVSGERKRMADRVVASNEGALEASSYWETARYERDLEYVSSLPKESGYDHWYDSRVMAVGQGARGHRDYKLPVDQIAGEGQAAQLEVALAGNVKATHHLRLYVNGTQVYDGSWLDRNYTTATAVVPGRLLSEGDNTVRVELINDLSKQAIDIAYVDWIALRYQRRYSARSGQFAFASPAAGSWHYAISNFPDDGANNAGTTRVDVYDITLPEEPVQLSTTVNEGNITFSEEQMDERRYLALTATQYLSPTAIQKANPTELLSITGGADYIVISHPDFIQAIQPLVDYRTKQGYRVRLINVQDIYDGFSYGRVSTRAIHDFLAYAYAFWSAPAPSYVLLVGDGNYDPKGNLPNSKPSFIPPYLEMVDPQLGETAADNRYVTVAGEDLLPDMHLGRFPAQTAADVMAMVEKTIRYESIKDEGEGAAWTHNLLFVADNPEGGGGSFTGYSDSIADGEIETRAGKTLLTPANYTRQKVYLGETCPDDSPALTCRQQIVERMNQGALLVSYIGHGAKEYWAEEQLLNLNTLTQLDNANRLPVMVSMTCMEGYYHEAAPNVESMGESIVRMPGGGAVASWSPTGFGLASGHDYLQQGLYLALFHEDMAEIGAAATFGKLYLFANTPAGKYDDLVDTFVLLGDPALRMKGVGVHQQFLPLLMR